jgi:hypothetical protein
MIVPNITNCAWHERNATCPTNTRAHPHARARNRPVHGGARTHTRTHQRTHMCTLYTFAHTHTHTHDICLHPRPLPPTSSLGRRLTTGCRGAGACGFVPNSSDVFGEPVFLKSRVFCSALASTCGDALGSLWPLCVVWLVLTSTRCSGFGQEGPSALAQTVDIAHSRGRVLTNRIAQTAFPGSHPECCVHDGYIESPTFN